MCLIKLLHSRCLMKCSHGIGPLLKWRLPKPRFIDGCMTPQVLDCLLCPTGFAANMALMTAIGSIGSLLAGNSIPSEDEQIAVFSDALNHASIIDGLRLAERQKSVKVFIILWFICFMLNYHESCFLCLLIYSNLFIMTNVERFPSKHL
ncbi:unnamed protein product [Lupinus luteus]|uniref:Aminotransferase class I/classII domain-containing protein n=1 Tax=Lupinus luteus TaxID=3873 RepID=A0AAV1WNT9_LUPLU